MNYIKTIRGKEAKNDIEIIKQTLSDNSMYRIEIFVRYEGALE